MSTATFVDFQQLKQSVSIIQVAQMLSLKLTQRGNQMRGPCAACGQGGDRAIAINADGRWYCFSAKTGGDAISLCAHITGKSQRDAAHQIATHFRFAGGSSEQPAQQPPAQPVRKSGFDAQSYLAALDPASELLQAVGVSPETLREFRAGYCKSGLNRGKLAIALCDREGNILGFAGKSLDGTTPALSFPNGVNPRDVIFGADKVPEGELRLMRDPVEVMQASEVGEPAICFLTDDIEPQQLEMLSSLLDANKARLFF